MFICHPIPTRFPTPNPSPGFQHETRLREATEQGHTGAFDQRSMKELRAKERDERATAARVAQQEAEAQEQMKLQAEAEAARLGEEWQKA